jgi:hypothetical protein
MLAAGSRNEGAGSDWRTRTDLITQPAQRFPAEIIGFAACSSPGPPDWPHQPGIASADAFQAR